MAVSYTHLDVYKRQVDGWVRNHLRYCIWHHWKKCERKRKNLIRLGVDPDHAYAWSRTKMGGWAVAQSPILNTTITCDRLEKRGYESMLSVYQKIAPHLNEPLYARPARTVVWEALPVSFYWRGRLLDCMLGFIHYSLIINSLQSQIRSIEAL